MLIGKKEFIAGLLMATISVSAATKLTSLYAVNIKTNPEVEFSQRIGLFDSERLSEATLKSSIAEIAFYRGLNLILVDKGIVNSFNTANLEKLGITKTAAPMCSITRQKATETIFRALMHASDRGNIVIPARQKDVSFKDWTPSEKYQDSAEFSIKNHILKGVGQNVFKPSKKLTVREAIILLQRIYELDVKPVPFFKDLVGNQKAEKKVSKTKTIYIEPELHKFFKDVSPTNPMAETMKKLINAGAFDQTILNHEASLPKSIKNSDFTLVCKGMLNKAGKVEICKDIDSIASSLKPSEAVNRNTLAIMGATMANAYPHKVYTIQAKYSDVEPDSETEKALKELSKAGIRMGYSDGNFKGEEKVSRYEAFNLLNIIVGDAVSSRIKITTINVDEIPALQPAVEKNAEEKSDNKSDIEADTKVEVKQEKAQVQESPKQETEITKVEESKTQPVAKAETKASIQAEKLEQQLRQKYSGMSFQERMELRKAQFRRILNG